MAKNIGQRNRESQLSMDAQNQIEFLRTQFQGLEVELDTSALEHELNEKLFLDGYVNTNIIGVSLVVRLSGDYELVIRPNVELNQSLMGWYSELTLRDPRTSERILRNVLSVICTLRTESHRNKNLVTFEVQASSLERVVMKALNLIQRVAKLRLLALPIETIQ